jgi:hypothetical protein
MRAAMSKPRKRTDGDRRRRASLAALVICGAGLAAAAPAAAASVPSASTGPARGVSYATATLTGSVNPQGQDTTYFFQYGPTKAYGLQTALADAGAGKRTVNVSLAISGLQPITRYHFRLLAVNASGAAAGGDRSFMTTKVPLSLAILVSPNPVLYGGGTVVQGTLSGTGNAAVPVALQANPFPYVQGFADVGNAAITNTNGSFFFPVPGLTQLTQFRVVTISNHPVISPVALEYVQALVNSHVRHTSRRHFARIYGTVTPAQDGAQVGILRLVHGRGVLVGGTTLHHRDATSSSFSRVVHVGPGVYRVLVRIPAGAVLSNYGRPLVIR